MPRKSSSSDARTVSGAAGGRLVKSIYVGASNALRWSDLKRRLRFDSDIELVQHLLDLAESTHDKSTQEQVSNENEENGNLDEDGESAAEEVVAEQQPAADLNSPACAEKNDDAQHTDVENKGTPHSTEHESRKSSKSHPGKKAHKHHRKRKHHRSSGEKVSKEQQQQADDGQGALDKEPADAPSNPPEQEWKDNHKHHHDKKNKSSNSSRGKKKRKHRDKSTDERPLKQHHQHAAAEAEASVKRDTHEIETALDQKFSSPNTSNGFVEIEPSSSPNVPESKHKRKHKKKYKKRSEIDSRKAPADGVPEPPKEATVSPDCCVIEEVQPEVVAPSTQPEPEIQRFPPFVSSPLPPLPPPAVPMILSTELVPELPGVVAAPTSQIIESPRVAIKLKLCIECSTRHFQDNCPLHNPDVEVKDDITLSEWVSLPDSTRKSFAEESLPSALLKLEERDATHGPSVVARVILKRLTQFGPLLAERIREMDIADDFNMRDIWEVCTENDKFYLSTIGKDHSNWLRYIRPAPSREKRNVAAIVRNGKLFFVTLNIILPGTELLFWLESAASGWSKKKMERTNCGGCNLKFSNSLYYRIHCSVFHDPNFSLTIRKYHCKVCGLSVLGKENIMKHAAEQHGGKGAYQCQFCKKFFLRLNYLEMHRTYGCAANPQRTRPLCDFCGRKFCQPQKLKVHIKRMHSDLAEVLKEFQCKMCHKLLGSRAALQRHLKEVHHKDMIGACTCDRCGKMFQNKSNLKIHMLTHSGVKPFRCKEGTCMAAFTTKQCLQFHYKKVHGFTDDSMPKIERCVAYTFDAYAGGQTESGSESQHQEPDETISPPFTPTGSDDSPPPSPSLPSLEEDENSRASNLAIVNETNSVVLESNLGSVQPDSVISNSSSPPIIVSPTNSPMMSSDLLARPGTILSKASKKWMGDIIVSTAAAVAAPVEMMLHEKRWHGGEMLQPEQVQVVVENQEMLMDKNRWGEEVNNLRNEISSIRRSDLSGYTRILRPGDTSIASDLPDPLRRSPNSMGADFGSLRRQETDDFGPLRRQEPSASLLVEAALDAAERDLTVKLAELKTIPMDPSSLSTNLPGSSNSFLSRLNGMHSNELPQEVDYGNIVISNKSNRIPETGLDMSYKQYDNDMVVPPDITTDYRVMRSPEMVFEQQEQGLDMSRNSAFPSAGTYARFPELLPPHLHHHHHRAAVAAAGLMYEVEPVRCQSPPPQAPSPPPYQSELLRHHWHHLPPTAHHTLDLSTARGVQVSPDQSISPPPPPNYQNYPPSSAAAYHASTAQPRAPTPNYHQHSGYYYSF